MLTAGAPDRREPVLGQAVIVSKLLDDESQDRLRAGLAEAGWPVTGGGRLEAVAVIEVTDPAARRSLRQTLEVVLVDRWGSERAGEMPLGRIFPGCDLLPDGPFPQTACGARLRGVLNRAGWTHWATLTERSLLDAASLSNLGTMAMAELVAMCFERSLEGVAATAEDAGADDLTVVLRHERSGGSQPVLEALLDIRSSDAPRPVRDAAGRLVKREAPWALDHDAAVVALLRAAGDERSRLLFDGWSSWREPRSLPQLANESGISAQRAGQVVHRFDSRLRAGLNVAPGPLPWIVSRLRARLGPVTTVERAEHVLGCFDLVGPAGDLVLWLAGPYRPVPSRSGWLALGHRTVVAHTASCLAADGGVRPIADVEADLGLSGQHLRAWLLACQATIVHELAVSLAGPLPDIVERILDAHGRTLTAAAITACLAEGDRVTTDDSLRRALRAKRFVRHPDGNFGLADWESVPSGPAPPRSPDARPWSTESTTSPDDKALDDSRRDDRLWLWVRVDTDVLRGGEAVVPGALAEGLGLRAPARRTFSSRYGPIALAADGPHPTRGSVRAIALAAGARHGDTVLLGFSRDGDVHVEVRCPTGPLDAADPPAGESNPAGPPNPFAHLLTGGTP